MSKTMSDTMKELLLTKQQLIETISLTVDDTSLYCLKLALDVINKAIKDQHEKRLTS